MNHFGKKFPEPPDDAPGRPKLARAHRVSPVGVMTAATGECYCINSAAIDFVLKDAA